MQKLLVLATALSSLTSGVRAEPRAVHDLMCNSPAQVEQFAEAALGAGLSIEDAQLAVNNAAGDAQACVFVPVVVDNVHDEKQLRYNGQTYVVRRVAVVALMRQTKIGWISQAIAPRVQFSLAVKEKLRRIILPKRHVR